MRDVDARSRLHSGLLRLYPRSVRRKYGHELLQFWALQRHEERYRGALGRVRFLGSVLRDAVRSGIRGRRTSLSNPTPPGRRGSKVGDAFRSLGVATRSLIRSPTYTWTGILTLGLGIGATTSVFGAIFGVVLNPLPYPNSNELVAVQRTNDEGTPAHSYTNAGWPDFSDWREESGEYLRLAGYLESNGTFEWGESAESLQGTRVTYDLFDVLGVEPVLGRAFTPEEDRLYGPPAVILSHDVWTSRFGEDPNILGRTIVLDGESIPVVGVMPRGFSFPGGEIAYYRPVQEERLLVEVGLEGELGSRTLSFLDMIGRLQPGWDAGSAEIELRTLVRSIDEEHDTLQEGRSVAVNPLLEVQVGDADQTMGFLFGAALLVLLVACSNLAGLTVNRTMERNREISIRKALGAGSWQVTRQIVSECLVLSLAGGLLGIGTAYGLTGALVAIAPPGLPRVEEVHLGPTAIGFGFLLTLLCGLLLAVAPSLQARRSGLAKAFSGSRGATEGASALRVQKGLVLTQVALTVVLLSAAALLTLSFQRLTREDSGFDPEGVLIASIEPSAARYSSPEVVAGYYERILESVEAVPGVRSASTIYSAPLAGNEFRMSILPEGMEETEPRRMAGSVGVGLDYFETMGIPILDGRGFNRSDRLDTTPVVVVNRTMAEWLWPGESAIGKRFVHTGGVRGSADSFDPAYFPQEGFTVVGVAQDVRRISLGQPPEPEFYRPHRQISWGFQYLVVRVTGRPTDFAAAIEERIWEIDPSTAVYRVRSLRSQVSDSVALPRFRTIVTLGFSVLACFLAMVGVYSVMSLVVNRRTREIGIRMALGANRRLVVRRTLSREMLWVGGGAMLGLLAAVFGGRTLESLLYDVQANDRMTLMAVGIGVVGIALLASWLPARRASRIDPVQSLKSE